MGFKTVGMAKGEQVLLGNLGSDSSVLSVSCDGDGKKSRLVADVLLGFESLMDLRDALDARILEVLEVRRVDLSALVPGKEDKAIREMKATIERADRSARA